MSSAALALFAALFSTFCAAVLPNGLKWAYLKGPTTIDSSGTYTPVGVYDSAVIPGGQVSASCEKAVRLL